MLIDLLLGLAVVLSIAAGVFRGALAEVLSLLALAAAAAAAQALGAVLLPVAAYLMPNASALAVHAAATLLGGLVVLLVGTAAGALVVRLARKRGKRFTTPDRLAGGALGGCRAVFLWLLAAAFVPSADAAPASAVAREMRKSLLLAAANRANPLRRLPFIQDLRTFEAILADRARQAAFLDLPETRRLLAHPRVEAALNHPEAQAALARRDFAQLLRTPALHAALLDPSVLSSLRSALSAYRRRGRDPFLE
jgi:uncharacterized membrane protein required for colicin V production